MQNLNVPHDAIIERFGRKTLYFEDFEGARLMLVVDDGDGIPYGEAWVKEEISADNAIVGLGPVKLTVRNLAPTEKVLTEILGFELAGSYPSEVLDMPDI